MQQGVPAAAVIRTVQDDDIARPGHCQRLPVRLGLIGEEIDPLRCHPVAG